MLKLIFPKLEHKSTFNNWDEKSVEGYYPTTLL